MIELKTEAEIETMREAGRVVATALHAAREHARAGTELRELDEVVRSVIDEAGAKPSFLHYRPRWAPTPFPGVLCCSVNDVVVHGIPDSTRLTTGDLVSIDCGASLDGWHGDAAVTFGVGPLADDDARMLRIADHALQDGIAAAVPGNRTGDISRAVGVVVRSAGFGVPAQLGGHGIGRDLHQAPFVPNDGRPATGTPLRSGMVLAIEPMLLGGGDDDVRGSDDGWALRTGDGSRAAHVEHTVAITDSGPRVLTVR